MSKEASPPAAESAEVPVKKSGLVPMVAALVAGLAVGGGAGAFVVGPLLAAGIAPAVSATAHGDSATAEGEPAEGAPAGEAGEAGAPAVAAVHVIDNLVLNPASSGGTRFLLLTVAFDLKNAAMVESMKGRDAEVRDHVLNIVGARTVEQLAEMSTREALKVELARDLGALLKDRKAIRQIYFPQFVIQ